jgi:hypothetical protein
MIKKSRGFPLEYYPGEMLTEQEARKNRTMFLFVLGSTTMGGVLAPNLSVMLPAPTPISIIHFPTRESMNTKTRHIPIIVPMIPNRPNKILLTDKQIDEFYQICSKVQDGSISMKEAILQLRGGGRLKYILMASYLAYYLYQYQYPSVEGFQPIRPPHLEWMPEGAPKRPPYAGGYGSSNSGSSLGLTNRNDGFNKLTKTQIQNTYSRIPNLSVEVEGTNFQITAWSVAKHVHHGPNFGLDPAKYGMTLSDLNSIAKNGLINHIRDGGTAPTDAYVQALQKCWKAFTEHKSVRYCGIESVMGEDCHVVKHDRSRLFLSFKVDRGESFTGYKLEPHQSTNHDTYGIIGKNYKN